VVFSCITFTNSYLSKLPKIAFTTFALISYCLFPALFVGIEDGYSYPPSTIAHTSTPSAYKYALIMTFQNTKLVPLNKGGLIEDTPP